MSTEWQNRLTAPFITSLAMPTAAELAFAYDREWLRRQTLVDLALAKYERGFPMHAAEEELTTIMSNELDHVEDLVASLRCGAESFEERAGYWGFAMLAWLWEHRAAFDEVTLEVEMIAADLEYPPEIMPLTSFVPADHRSSEDVFREYLERNRARYLRRDRALIALGNNPSAE